MIDWIQRFTFCVGARERGVLMVCVLFFVLQGIGSDPSYDANTGTYKGDMGGPDLSGLWSAVGNVTATVQVRLGKRVPAEACGGGSV
jgi:hypothetical protein